MFQQRHFEAIAQMMQELSPRSVNHRDHGRPLVEAQWAATVTALCQLFQHYNEHFDTERFERACKPGANVRAGSEA